MNDYSDRSNTELLHDYAGARRELASVLADIRTTKRWLEQAEARVARTVEGKNAELRKAALVEALSSDGDHSRWEIQLFSLEARRDELEAEVEIISKFLQGQQWGIRLRLIELLERRGLSSEGLTTPVMDAELDGAFEAPLLVPSAPYDDDFSLPF